MTDANEYDFTTIAREIAQRENIPDHKLEHDYAGKKGDGYIGSVCAVRLVAANNPNHQLALIFKYSPRKEHAALPIRDAFLTEIAFYATIAPAYRKFQASHRITAAFDNYAKFYGAVQHPGDELLALENLTETNYALWDRTCLMNTANLRCALRTFAKFHATGFAMKTLQPEVYKTSVVDVLDGKDNLPHMFRKMNFYEQVQAVVRDVLDVFKINEHKGKMMALADVLPVEMERMLNYHDAYDVLLQGDCWCNNAMYRYTNMEDRSEAVDMKMLDFQMVRFGSPAFDLSYFLYTISSKESMESMHDLLDYYYRELRQHLQLFGLDAAKVYPFEILMQHWRKLAKFGLIMSVVVRKAMAIKGEDVPDLTEDTDNFLGRFKMLPDEKREYDQQMRDVVEHFVSFGYL